MRVALVEAGGTPPAARGDARRGRLAAARPRRRLDVHRRPGRRRQGPHRRPDDGAAGQDAGRVVRAELHGLRPRPPRRLRRAGPPTAPRAGPTTTCCPTSPRARTSHPRTRPRASSSRTTCTAPAARSGSRCARRARSPPSSSSRPPRRPGSRWATTTAATAAARSGARRLFQTTTRDGKRSSTYHAFLEPALERANLTVITHAQVEQVLLESTGSGPRATGVRYRDADGAYDDPARRPRGRGQRRARSGRRSCCSCRASARRDELASVGVECVVDNPHVGKHLKDHLHVPLVFPAPGVALTMTEIAIALGPDALRAPAGPLPADPSDDADLPAGAGRAQGRGRAPGDGVGDHREGPGVVVASTTRSPSSPPGWATRTPTTPRSGCSPAATPPTSGATSSASSRPTTSTTRTRLCHRAPRPSSCSPTRCSRTPRARCAWSAPTSRTRRGST